MEQDDRDGGPAREGRRRHRARRRWFDPGRQARSEREAFLEKALEGALARMAGSGRTAPPPAAAEPQLAQMQDLLQRTKAEFDNYRKRTLREKDDLRKHAVQNFVHALIPALDSFDHALTALEQDHDAQALAQGIAAIHQQILKILQDQGVEILAPLDQPFDPHQHEAIAVQPTDAAPENTVLDVVQKGYALHGRLVRPARVRIAGKP